MLHQAKNSEEKAKKAMVDAARLADELRAEQDHTNSLSSTKRALEGQFSELEMKCNDANENAMRNGRAAMAKLETRIRELEIELGNVQARSSENIKGYQKSERRCKELAFRSTKTRKTKTGCPNLLLNFKRRSKHTRDKLRRLKKPMKEPRWQKQGFMQPLLLSSKI